MHLPLALLSATLITLSATHVTAADPAPTYPSGSRPATPALSLSMGLPTDQLASNASQPAPFQTQPLGKSIGGRAIHCEVYGHGPDVLMIIATIHGNESSGTPLVAAFARWLRQHPDELAGHTVVIVPVANPDGFATNERFNAHHVDLNRNFPATNWADKSIPNSTRDSDPALNLPKGRPPSASGLQPSTPHQLSPSPPRLQPGNTPLSEPESRILMQLICHHFPHRIISIHQPLACIDYDGPAEPLARAIAKECPLPVRQLGSRPGSLGSFIGVTLNRAIITLELPKDAGQDQDKLWETYGEALIAALRFNEMPPPNNYRSAPSNYRLFSPVPASPPEEAAMGTDQDDWARAGKGASCPSTNRNAVQHRTRYESPNHVEPRWGSYDDERHAPSVRCATPD